MSMPPSRPTKYLQAWLVSRAMRWRTSARRRAPDMISSRESGVWRTPLGTSTLAISKCGWPGMRGAITARASRTASSFGLRVLPTATMIEFSGEFESVGAFTAGFAFGRRRVKLGPVSKWSGIRESNSRLHLGKVAYYHYTNPAYGATTRRPKTFIAWRSRRDKSGPKTRIANGKPPKTPTGGSGRGRAERNLRRG